MALTNAITVINRALGLADVGTDAEWISYNDRFNSINESYRDLYAKLTHSDDDYYVKTVLLSTTNAQLSVNGNSNEYELVLPSDVYKIRAVDYQGTSSWIPMRKFNMGMKDFNPSDVMYRWKNNTLWDIGNSWTGSTSIRLTYYPPPATVTLQQPTLLYDTNATPVQRLLTTSASPCYIPQGNTSIYNLFASGVSNTIVADSIDNNLVTTIYTSTDLTTALGNIQYINGYVYWTGYNTISTKYELFRGIWDGATALSGIISVNLATAILDFSIVFTGNSYSIYVYTSTGYQVCDINLANFTGLTISPNLSHCLVNTVNGLQLAYINANALYIGTTLLATNITQVNTDGTYLYGVTTGNSLVKFSVNYDAVALVYSVTLLGTLYTNVLRVSAQNVYQDQYDILNNQSIYIGAIDALTNQVIAIDSNVTFSFDYPSNMVYEIMSYQCACDFKRKQGADMGALEARGSALMKRFFDSIKRDEYQPERIQNFYAIGGRSSIGY